MASGPNPSRVLFDSTLVRYGQFRCPPDSPLWRLENLIGDGHNIVFPRTFVEIRPAGQPALVTSPNLAMFYNQGQHYERRLVSPAGDSCEWVVLREDVLLDMLAAIDPDSLERAEHPFSSAHAQSDTRAYLLQRHVYHALTGDRPVDPVAVDELLIEATRRQVAMLQSDRKRRHLRREIAARRDREIVDAVRRLLAQRFCEPLSLDQIAAASGCSVFHLCRVYRQHAGLPVHKYLRRLRVRAALDRLAERDTPITSLALDVGFSSQSHFTDAFRAEFGASPARLRRALRAGQTPPHGRSDELS